MDEKSLNITKKHYLSTEGINVRSSPIQIMFVEDWGNGRTITRTVIPNRCCKC